jgi:hypothetical protein
MKKLKNKRKKNKSKENEKEKEGEYHRVLLPKTESSSKSPDFLVYYSDVHELRRVFYKM